MREEVHFIEGRFKQKAVYQKVIDYLDELGSLPNLPDKHNYNFDM